MYFSCISFANVEKERRNVEKEINVPLQAYQIMEYANLNRIPLESTALALKIVNGINWKHAVIRVNVFHDINDKTLE